MASERLTQAWWGAEAAKPAGWHLMGLRCTSTGLDPDLRSERWVAEACGPWDGCLRIEADTGEDALLTLTVKLEELSRAVVPGQPAAERSRRGGPEQ